MIFVDSNIPTYLVGEEHRHRTDARRLLERTIAERERLVTDAEFFQEILHRYFAIRRKDAIRPAWDLLRQVADEIFPVEFHDVERARSLLAGKKVSARDALHLAIMERHGVKRIMTFDRGFDGLRGITRIHN